MADASSLQQVADGLVMTFQRLVTDMTDKKPTFDQLVTSPGALQFLQQIKSTSTTLGQTMISKVPVIAQQSVDQIIAALDRGIQTYNAGGGNTAGRTAGLGTLLLRITGTAGVIGTNAVAVVPATGAEGVGEDEEKSEGIIW